MQHVLFNEVTTMVSTAWQAQFDSSAFPFCLSIRSAQCLIPWIVVHAVSAKYLAMSSNFKPYGRTKESNYFLEIHESTTYAHGNVDMHTRIGMPCIESIRAPIKINQWRATGLCDPSHDGAPNKIPWCLYITWSQVLLGKTSLGLRITGRSICKVPLTCHWSPGRR